MGGIIKSGARRRFASIPNDVCCDDSLTWEARGMLAYLLSKPTTWQVNISDLINRSPAKAGVVRRVVEELIKAGYIIRERQRGDGGKFNWVWEVFDVAQTPESDSPPYAGFPSMDEPHTVEPSMDDPSVVEPRAENLHIHKDGVKQRLNKERKNEEERGENAQRDFLRNPSDIPPAIEKALRKVKAIGLVVGPKEKMQWAEFGPALVADCGDSFEKAAAEIVKRFGNGAWAMPTPPRLSQIGTDWERQAPYSGPVIPPGMVSMEEGTRRMMDADEEKLRVALERAAKLKGVQ